MPEEDFLDLVEEHFPVDHPEHSISHHPIRTIFSRNSLLGREGRGLVWVVWMMICRFVWEEEGGGGRSRSRRGMEGMGGMGGMPGGMFGGMGPRSPPDEPEVIERQLPVSLEEYVPFTRNC